MRYILLFYFILFFWRGVRVLSSFKGIANKEAEMDEGRK
jgi:hypothetical protein